MENTTNSVIYTVNSDLDDGILYAEFETKEAALAYAKRNMDKLPFIDELEVSRDADGEIVDVFSSQTIWAHNELDYPTNEFVDDDEDIDPWAELEDMYKDEEDGKHVIGDTTWFESMDNLVETLEENEDEVECKECFDLFPKVDCIKVDLGYICPTCAECGTVSEDDIFKIDFPELEKFSGGNDMIPEDPMPADEVPTETPVAGEPEEVIDHDSFSTPEEAVPFLVVDEEEAVAGYEKAAEVIEDSDLENKEEILDTIEHIKEEEEEHIEELIDLVDTNTDDDPAAEDDEVIDVENDPISEEEESEEILNEASGLKTWLCFYDGDDVGSVRAYTEDEAMEAFMDRYSDTYFFDSTDHDFGVEEVTDPREAAELNRLTFMGRHYDPVDDFDPKKYGFELGKKYLINSSKTHPKANGQKIQPTDILCPADKMTRMDNYVVLFQRITPMVHGNATKPMDTYKQEIMDLQTFVTFITEADKELVEHVNQENPAIESDQELEGTDNAVEKCKTTPVVTHSKDDLPLDSCDHEKLTEATMDELNQIFRLCKEIGIKTGGDLNRFIKDEVAEGQNLLDALKAYRANLGDDFEVVHEKLN